MKYIKALFFTFLYYVLLNGIGFWFLLIPIETEYLFLIKLHHFINTSLLLMLIVYSFKVFNKTYLKFEKTITKFYLISIFFGIGFVFFQPFLNCVYYQNYLINYNYSFQKLSSISVLTSIFISPIIEELFFRNFLQRELSRKYRPILTIFLSAILYSLIHINFAGLYIEEFSLNLHQAYIAFFGGLISSTLYYKTKSIIPSIIFHIVWNFTSYIIY